MICEYSKHEDRWPAALTLVVVKVPAADDTGVSCHYTYYGEDGL